jgi:integrase
VGKGLEQITQHDVQSYVSWNLQNRKHNGCALRFWSIRQYFAWAGRPELAENVPHLRWVDAGKPALREQELDKILATIERLSPKHRIVYYLENDCIRRPSEILNVRLDDRDGDILRYYGKTQGLVGARFCLMTERLMAAWDDYLKVRPIPATKEDAPYLLLHDYGQYRGRRMADSRALTTLIREVMMAADVVVPMGEKPTNYLVKRTTITRQLLSGADVKIIQAQAGHTDPKTTLKYHRIDEDDTRTYLRSWADKIPSADKIHRIKQKPQISADKNVNCPPKTPGTDAYKIRRTEDNTSASFSFSTFSLLHSHQFTPGDGGDDFFSLRRWSSSLYSVPSSSLSEFLSFSAIPSSMWGPTFPPARQLIGTPTGAVESNCSNMSASHSPSAPGPTSDSLWWMELPNMRSGGGVSPSLHIRSPFAPTALQTSRSRVHLTKEVGGGRPRERIARPGYCRPLLKSSSCSRASFQQGVGGGQAREGFDTPAITWSSPRFCWGVAA